MNIYTINVWGPCLSESEVLDRRSKAPDNTATVFASSKEVANQVCYLVATRNVHGRQSNYQEIDGFLSPVACVLETAQDPITFESKVVEDLIANPILPSQGLIDTQHFASVLFFVRCIKIGDISDTTGTIRGQFWVYAPNAEYANAVATEYGDAMGLFDPDTEAIQVQLHRLEKTCVFWNVTIRVCDLQFNPHPSP